MSLPPWLRPFLRKWVSRESAGKGYKTKDYEYGHEFFFWVEKTKTRCCEKQSGGGLRKTTSEDFFSSALLIDFNQ